MIIVAEYSDPRGELYKTCYEIIKKERYLVYSPYDAGRTYIGAAHTLWGAKRLAKRHWERRNKKSSRYFKFYESSE